MAQHKWRFYRAGGVDQVQLTTGADLAALGQLDQKLWVALSCPVQGLEFDERTLRLIDTDGDHRVRAPELIAAAEWSASVLKDVEQLARGSDILPLSAIDTTKDEGKLLEATARSLLAAIGKADASSISVEDTTLATEAFNKEARNGDGILPVTAIEDEELKQLVTEILAGIEAPKVDRSGEPGVDEEDLTNFTQELNDYVAWIDAGQPQEIRLLGDKTDEAFAAYQAVAAKIDDFFARTRVAAFDARALGSLNRDEAAYTSLTETELDKTASNLSSFPLAHIAPLAPLPLDRGVNPAWIGAIHKFKEEVVTPLLGQKAQLEAADWAKLQEKWTPYLAWHGEKKGARVEALGIERVRSLAQGDLLGKLSKKLEEDREASDRANAIEQVEKLVRLNRDLLTLANNFVSFRDFYGRKKKAIFQYGTLYLDQRACDLCVLVNDAGRHASLAPLSRIYLAYCDLKDAEGQVISIAAAITDGGVDNLMVGRNGLFYDRQGKDWDATITKIVDNPISVREAFWSPYKKLLRIIEEQITKRAAAADAEADAKINAKAGAIDGATQGEVAAPPPAPKKIDIGVVAALGVAVGGITAALGMLLEAFFGLGFWMPLGILGLLLVISGPSMAIAWLKLRQRNIGPLLDANGWAVNVLTKVNVPLGKSLTAVATLPAGARRDLVDPFAPKKKPWWLITLLALLLAGGVLWFIGKLDAYLPEGGKSTTVLGEAAPAHVKVTPAPAEPAAAE